MAYLLIPSCRGRRGGSSGHGGVGNGGLWWPEWTSEGDGVALLSRAAALFPLLASPETKSRTTSVWKEVDRGGARLSAGCQR